jgi:hypothetical protein
MKLQACRFKRAKHARWERGVAVLSCFDSSDVEFILDESGKRLRSAPWNYDLALTADRPHHSIDTSVVILPEKISAVPIR